jgi:glycosyltransferase involved in cell wall biosynthesis
MVEFSLVLPIYNEEGCVEKVLRDYSSILDREQIDYEIVAVNNGSVDKTGEIIDRLHKENPRITPYHVKVNEGMTNGVVKGLDHAKGDNLGFSDGDGQVPAEAIVKVWHTFKDSNAMLAKGTRINRQDGIKRRVASYFYNFAIGAAFLFRMDDVNGKPKIFKREFYDQINIETKEWFLDGEVIIKLLHKGYKAKEVKVNFPPRESGASKVSYFTVREFMKSILYWRIALWKKKK